MKTRFAFICISLILSGCATITAAPVDKSNYLGYQPIDPVPQSKVMVYDAQSGVEKEVYWEALSVESKRTLLPIQSAHVTVTNSDLSGKISYLTSSVSGEAGSYKVVMDYMKYRVVDVKDAKGNYIGSGHVGVGLRINAELVTKKSNLNLSGITAIGTEESKGNLTGGISVDIIGIDSRDVTNLIPLTATIDQSSIQAALQALASIKTKLWDSTTITPHLVATRQEQPSKQNEIKNAIVTLQSAGFATGGTVGATVKP